MGLPLACRFAQRGARVLACDVNPAAVEAINRGRPLIDEPGVTGALRAALKNGRLAATTDTRGAVSKSGVVVVIVPVLLTAGRRADLSTLEAATMEVAAGLTAGALVSYETTIPVGTTRAGLKPLLEASGLKAGKDFDLAFSPERVKSGSVLANLALTPKIVGGFNGRSTRRAARFYSRFLGAPVLALDSLEEAEFAKLAGMVYRDVNIALANDLSRYAQAAGLELEPVIAAANTDGESSLLRPGIGVGGHCTPVYPYFLTHHARELGVPQRIAEASRRINDGQSAHQVERLAALWGPLAGKSALILGLGFRPEVKEHACSSAFLLQEALRERQASVGLHDPHYAREEIVSLGFRPGSLDERPAPELLILNTAHRAFAKLDFNRLRRRGAKAVLDGRNFWDPEKVRRAGLFYMGIGRGPAVPAPLRRSIPVAKPWLGPEEEAAACRALESGWVAQGPEVSAFETEFASAVGAPRACAVANATVGLHLALRAVGVGPGDEVITVSHSFIATANSARYCGAIPVFADIEPGTFNMDPNAVEALITKRTRAILCVHQMGMPCDLGAILEISRRRGLPLVEDAACALGSEIRPGGAWEKIGKPHGDLAVFSFHPRKLLTTGEGGMIASRDSSLDSKLRLWRNHGGAGSSHRVLGYNYRMTDIQAAVGREQVKRLGEIVMERREAARRYGGLLAGHPGFQAPAEPSWARSNWQSYCVRLPEGAPQARVIERLARRGISARPGIGCAHLEPAYSQEPWRAGAGALRESEKASAGCLILPLYHRMPEADQEFVIRELAAAVRRR